MTWFQGAMLFALAIVVEVLSLHFAGEGWNPSTLLRINSKLGPFTFSGKGEMPPMK
jgi:hypothetical protein